MKRYESCIYICYTMYQMLMAYTINKQLKSSKAYLILGADNLKKYEKNEILNSCFDKIKWIDVSDCEKLKKKYFFTPHKAISRVLGDIWDYSDVFYYNNQGILEFLYKHSQRKNMDVMFHIFEEGMLLYQGDILLEKEIMYLGSERYKKFNRLIWKYSPKNVPSDMWFCNPRIAEKNTKLSCHEINIDLTKDSKDELNKIWSFEKKEDFEIKEKYIFLGDVFDIYQDFDEYQCLINRVAEKVGYNNFIYKPHPRAPINLVDNRIKTYDIPIPWELYLMNYDVADKILIFTMTNAGFMPICSWKMQVSAICIYDMFKKRLISFDYFEEIEKLFDIYKKNFERLLFVKDEEELMNKII